MLSRENALALAKVQQCYEWKQTFKMIEQFKQAMLAHGRLDLTQDLDHISGQFEIVRDADSVEDVTPEHFKEM